MHKTIGILAHVDAGKTTFSEQLLYHTKEIRERGRVDHKDAFLDSHLIERQRGITIFADQASFEYKGSTYTMIDTPGHVDFSPEMERMIQVMDYAVLIISATDGVQGHTETVWRLLRKHGVPTFIFVNKMDRETADFEAMLAELQSQLSQDICDINSGLQDGMMTEELAEWIAERDELLMEKYFDNGYEKGLWHSTMRKLVQGGTVFPCAAGSALKDEGVLDFLDNLDLLTETIYDPAADFSAHIYKVRYDEKGNRFAYMKAKSGTLRVRDEVMINGSAEKITGIYKIKGSQLKPTQEVVAGELFAVAGLPDVQAGVGIGMKWEKHQLELIPTLKAKVIHESGVHVKEVLRIFNMLDREEPSLQIQWDEHFQAIHVHVMGVIQLEVLKEVVQERFGIAVNFEKPQILYKETIGSEVIGYGHFEPLRHYAEVHLKLEPSHRGSGVTFENKSHPNDLPIGFQNLVQQHVLERDHHGLLTGSALTDVKITLLTGRGHQEHTSGGDFREATFRAIRQGLEKADNILLEPYYNFRIKVVQDEIGRILSDIQQASGTFEAPQTIGTHVVVTGRVPVETFMDYPADFASYTHGKGILSLVFGGYDRCHNEEEVIEEIGYDKNADPEYTSSSIFCTKGAGYSVPWDEVEKKMHCL
ncbi:TetM/TetW/TetO/TetS family tetracycline resistance ribosomal protection protein [Aciduricibacillus chroicocephali]|uniref:TetM/TetW/TetO/TetS family tetracycline resistance ribosomal protection protein n=1 Tax=Aciduricibacillus chroicocephali TaxID=3054939 RepID=A0ABY9KZ83_9BACI|nr:TetM/TetW/TetO/TetS family tetracycline resistance ribosomal protection protein [Bacillaceae bacterium 44XB]